MQGFWNRSGPDFLLRLKFHNDFRHLCFFDVFLKMAVDWGKGAGL
ncbi:hypothetical protein GGE07_003643 [Sinorhizobium terangae]|nr:hypothetical protein [Sinorhizobium terangae]